MIRTLTVSRVIIRSSREESTLSAWLVSIICYTLCPQEDHANQKILKFIAHLRDVHRTVPPACSDMTPDTNDPNNYCVVCDKTLSDREKNTHHLIIFHLNKKPELYQGIDCTNPSKLNLRHSRYCADFQKVFLSKRLRRVHMHKIHVFSTLNRYRVHVCRSRHIRLPTETLSNYVNRNEIPDIDEIGYHCTACDKIYKNRAAYKTHLHKIHGIILPRLRSYKARHNINYDIIANMDDENNHCASCNKTYSNRRNYMHHLTTIHNMIKQEDTKETLNIRSINLLLNYVNDSNVFLYFVL
ncbi:hypothetical protein EDC94DRAFT_585036 [Helicostylum pulchrum]|nr:hypothetical protein EDC94DRAFT_585036 [Helicostylum pulchrum]